MKAASNNKLTANQRSGVRALLATGATLITLISAQMFAVSSTVSQSARASTTTQDTTASTQDTTATTTYYDDDNRSIFLTSDQAGSIFSTQSQPIPSSRSSR